MRFSNVTYNKIKWIILAVLFACGLLLDIAYEWEETYRIIKNATIVTIILGSIMFYSMVHYKKSDKRSGRVG